MKRNILFVILILWMVCVFWFSHQEGGNSSQMSEFIIEKIVEVMPWIVDIIDIDNIHFLIRKLAHFSIYAVGGIISFLYFSTFDISIKKAFLLAVSVCFLYAISDEIHQLFVQGRSGEFRDVLIDTSGAIVGSSLILSLEKLFLKSK